MVSYQEKEKKKTNLPHFDRLNKPWTGFKKKIIQHHEETNPLLKNTFK